MKARTVVAGAVLTAVSVVSVATAASGGSDSPKLEDVRTATARFHSTEQARKASYEPFLDCFDSDEGGMGQHLVNSALLADPAVEATKPEALVYEVRGDKLKLVGVEYIVPIPDDDEAADALRADPPRLFGVPFHENTSLGVMVLHAWVWRDHPTDIFFDWNPDVAACPD